MRALVRNSRARRMARLYMALAFHPTLAGLGRLMGFR